MPLSDAKVLQALRHDRDVDLASTLTQRFRQITRARAAASLDRWLTDGLASGLPELVHVASG